MTGVITRDPKAFCGLGIKPEPELNPNDEDDNYIVDYEEDDDDNTFEVVVTKHATGFGFSVAKHLRTGTFHYCTFL